MAKKLLINCSVCDARKIQQENYSHYEAITINCATMLTNANGKAVMNRLPFSLNCSNTLELEEEVDFRVVNGSNEIKSSDLIPQKKFYLMVNGSLTIGTDTRNHLAQCVGISVNGSLICPERIYTALPNINVNGSVTCYPDDAVVLKRSAVIDKLFALRAKNRLYWSAKRMIMTDPELEGEVLRRKGASFSSGEFIITQSKVEKLLELIDEKAEIIVVPDNSSVVEDDIILDEDALRRYGNRLYVIGDITVPEDGGILERLDYLNVLGDAEVPQEYKEKLLDTITQVSGKIKIAKPDGAVLTDKPYIKITRWMLERQPMGIDVSDCAIVKISEDIPKELIADRLHIEDCGIVKCSEEQKDAVDMICRDVGKVGKADGEEGPGLGDSILSAFGVIKGALSTKVVNAADYVL